MSSSSKRSGSSPCFKRRRNRCVAAQFGQQHVQSPRWEKLSLQSGACASVKARMARQCPGVPPVHDSPLHPAAWCAMARRYGTHNGRSHASLLHWTTCSVRKRSSRRSSKVAAWGGSAAPSGSEVKKPASPSPSSQAALPSDSLPLSPKAGGTSSESSVAAPSPLWLESSVAAPSPLPSLMAPRDRATALVRAGSAAWNTRNTWQARIRAADTRALPGQPGGRAGPPAPRQGVEPLCTAPFSTHALLSRVHLARQRRQHGHAFRRVPRVGDAGVARGFGQGGQQGQGGGGGGCSAVRARRRASRGGAGGFRP